MNVSTVFDRIFKAQKQREESRARDYRSLVAKIASGAEPPADRLEQILNAADKSVEQLRADVELYQQRRAWREQYDALPRLNERRRRSNGKLPTPRKRLRPLGRSITRPPIRSTPGCARSRKRGIKPRRRRPGCGTRVPMSNSLPSCNRCGTSTATRTTGTSSSTSASRKPAKPRNLIAPRPNTPDGIHSPENTSNGPSGSTQSACGWNPSCRLPRSRSRRWSSGRRRSWSGC